MTDWIKMFRNSRVWEKEKGYTSLVVSGKAFMWLAGNNFHPLMHEFEIFLFNSKQENGSNWSNMRGLYIWTLVFSRALSWALSYLLFNFCLLVIFFRKFWFNFIAMPMTPNFTCPPKPTSTFPLSILSDCLVEIKALHQTFSNLTTQ